MQKTNPLENSFTHKHRFIIIIIIIITHQRKAKWLEMREIWQI